MYLLYLYTIHASHGLGWVVRELYLRRKYQRHHVYTARQLTTLTLAASSEEAPYSNKSLSPL